MTTHAIAMITMTPPITKSAVIRLDTARCYRTLRRILCGSGIAENDHIRQDQPRCDTYGLNGPGRRPSPATLAPSALRTNTTAVTPSSRVVSGSAYVRIEP